MKIHIPVSLNPKTGKGFFCHRLAVSMKQMGVHLVNGSASHDVSLNVIKLANVKSQKKVLRLDGVYHNTAMDYKGRNKVLQRNLRAADAIIYQSKFSKSICDKYLGRFKGKVAIIPNGADISFYEAAQPIPKEHAHVFYASSRWRPHKRIKDIIGSFLLANIEDSILYISGDLKRSGIRSSSTLFSEKNVVYLGKVDQSTSARYLKSSDAFIHLCWFDNCPNGVVEAIASGTTVITNNVGGTHEIVRDSGGIVCNVDAPYDLSPVKLYSPPPINRELIAQGMIDCSKKSITINKANICINNIAGRYLDFFKEVKNG